MSRTHYISPRLCGIVGTCVFETLVVRVAEPAGANIIGSSSAEITVLVVACCTGLSKGIKSAYLCSACGTASAVNRSEQHTVHNRSGFLTHDSYSARCRIFKDGIALLICNQRIGCRRVVYTSAAEHNVCRSHFENGNAVGKSADRHRSEVVVFFVELD